MDLHKHRQECPEECYQTSYKDIPQMLTYTIAEIKTYFEQEQEKFGKDWIRKYVYHIFNQHQKDMSKVMNALQENTINFITASYLARVILAHGEDSDRHPYIGEPSPQRRLVINMPGHVYTFCHIFEDIPTIKKKANSDMDTQEDD